MIDDKFLDLRSQLTIAEQKTRSCQFARLTGSWFLSIPVRVSTSLSRHNTTILSRANVLYILILALCFKARPKERPGAPRLRSVQQLPTLKLARVRVSASLSPSFVSSRALLSSSYPRDSTAAATAASLSSFALSLFLSRSRTCVPTKS